MPAQLAVETETSPHVAPIDVETLFREHGRFVASFLRHMGAHEQDLDDMVQDVFVAAHRKGGYLPGPAAPRTWLASLAFRVVQTRRRARARRPPAFDALEELADEARGPADLVEARRSLARVQAALEHMSPEHRATFILFEIEGESCESIAATWEVPVGTVYSRLHHARKKFLAAYGGDASRKAAGRRGER